jgi:hypothetical protein
LILEFRIGQRWATSLNSHHKTGRLSPNNKKEQTMKKHIKIKQLLLQHGPLGSISTALLLLANTASTSFAQALPPDIHPYGLSYQEWAVKWLQWSFSQSTNNLELVGSPDIHRGDGSNVRFLAGVYIPGNNGITIETRKVTVDPGTPLFFSVLDSQDDNSGCNGNELDFSTNTVSELLGTVAGNWSYVTSTTCTVDGVPVRGLSDPATTPYLVITPPYSYTTASEGNVVANLYGVQCLPGDFTVYPSVAKGVFLMIPPLRPGKHVIEFAGIVGPATAPYVESDLTYEITVPRESRCGRN